MEFTEEQVERYSRQIILEEVGLRGQEKLLSSGVLLVGMGGLGSPAALYLAAAGVGTLGIMDGDRVDLTNLQRQVIHHTADVGREKTLSAAEKIRAINPDVAVRRHDERATAANLREIIRGYDFIIDGTDNFQAKFLVNDACWFERKPFSHAGILRFGGQLMTVLPGRTACYRCIFQKPPPPGAVPSCSQAGVLGTLAGVVGTLQAAEAIKFLLGKGRLLTDCLLTYDALEGTFRKVPLSRNPRCPLCGEKPEILELRDEGQVSCDLRRPAGGEIVVPRPLFEEMLAQAREEAPLEACGMLGGRSGRAVKYYRMTNVDRSPEHFSMKPEEQFAAAKDMRAGGLEMTAVCHSHPSSPARPSREDVRLALTPGAIHVILSLGEPSGPRLGGFRIENGVVTEVNVRVADDGGTS